MNDSSLTTPPQFAAAWRGADAEGDTDAANAALAGLARALQADTLARARLKLAKAAASVTDDPARDYTPLLDAWAAMDRDERAAILATEETPRERPQPLAVPKVSPDFPPAILSAAGLGGAILSVGTVSILSGEGGIAKSAMAGSIAHDLAALEPDKAGKAGTVCGGLFDAPTSGGPVLIAAYEDPAAVVAWRVREVSTKRETGSKELNRVHVLDMLGWPLFGPGEYGAADGPLEGWRVLADAVAEIKPRLVIIDPALAAFSGESNAAGPVRGFMSALAKLARDHACGVLLVAHSRKAARFKKGSKDADPFDPGMVGGSTHWTDGARGVLAMQWNPDPDSPPGARIVAVAKANWGPSRIIADLTPVTARKGAYVGMDGRAADAAGGMWLREQAKAGDAAEDDDDLSELD